MAYREEAAKKSDFERAELAKDKTGVCIDGLTAVNPVNGKEIPVWISDYVLMSYCISVSTHRSLVLPEVR